MQPRVPSVAALAALVPFLVLGTGCATEDPADAGEAQTDEDLRAAAKLLEDPDTSSNRTLWWPRQQLHERGRKGDFDGALGESWETKSGEGAGVLVRTPLRPLGAGKFIFLQQFLHDESPGTPLGKLVVRDAGERIIATKSVVAEEIEDDDWQRNAIEFELTKTTNVSLTFEWNGTAEVATGLASLTRPQRPFYNFGHNPNSIAQVDACLAGGANAIEPDIQYENGGLIVRETGNWLTNPLTGGNVKSNIDDYFKAVAARPQIVLVTLDIKPTEEIGYEEFGRLLYAVVTKYLPPEKFIFSLDNLTMVDAFKALPEVNGPGRDVSSIKTIPTGSTDPLLWSKTADKFGLNIPSMGISPMVPISLSRWFGPLAGLVKNRDRGGPVKKTYYWTAGKTRTMRKLMDMNLDGVLVDDNKGLSETLQTEPYRSMFRLATVSDSQFVAHGVPYAP